jgi:uncharacterized membrane protein
MQVRDDRLDAKDALSDRIQVYERSNNSKANFWQLLLLSSLKIILTLFFYAILTPIAICLRILGFDVAGKNFAPKLETYWQQRKS